MDCPLFASPVVARVPHWIRFINMANVANTKNASWWERNEANVPGNHSDVVEIVTNPNNPNNEYYEPLYEDSKQIHDLVYYWPNQQKKGEIVPRSDDIMVFSMSKIGSMPDLRLAWAFVKRKAPGVERVSFSKIRLNIPLHRTHLAKYVVGCCEDDENLHQRYNPIPFGNDCAQGHETIEHCHHVKQHRE